MVLNIHDQKRLRDRRGRAFYLASGLKGILAVRSALLLGLAVFTTACTTYGVVANQPLSTGETSPGYGFGEFAKKLKRQTGDLTLAVAFSGGGTRAAALAYGVMQELRATSVDLSGDPHSLLDATALSVRFPAEASHRLTTVCTAIACSSTSSSASCGATWRARYCAVCLIHPAGSAVAAAPRSRWPTTGRQSSAMRPSPI